MTDWPRASIDRLVARSMELKRQEVRPKAVARARDRYYRSARRLNVRRLMSGSRR